MSNRPGDTTPGEHGTFPYLHIPDLANELGISVAAARKLCREGTIPARMVGRGYIISRAALDRWLEHHRLRHPVPVRRMWLEQRDWSE